MNMSSQLNSLFPPVLLCLWLLITGCAQRTDFNDAYRQELQGSLQNVQFYISEGIVLRRIEEQLHRAVASDTHGLRIERSKKLIEVSIPKGTPGILQEADARTLFVQFEPSPPGEEMVIPFTRIRRTDMGQEIVYIFREGTLRYEDQEYQVLYPKREFPVYRKEGGRRIWSHNVVRESFPVLQIDPVDHFSTFEKQRRVAPGLRLD